MDLKIRISGDNAGLDHDEDVAQLVHNVARKIALGVEGGIIKDVNGNSVGSWEYDPAEDEEEDEEEEDEEDEEEE